MQYKLYFFAFLALFFSPICHADVVRPALIEISVNTNGTVRIEIRASIEALITGINGRYKNTQDSPNAELYDHYRVMQADELRESFEHFKHQLLEGVDLKLDGESVKLDIESVDIPEPGYTKVPRISLIVLAGEVKRDRRQLTWYYPARFGDHATRVRQVDEDNERWHWSDHQWIKQDVYSEPFTLDEIFTRRPFHQVLKTYGVAGFQHIVCHVEQISGCERTESRQRNGVSAEAPLFRKKGLAK